MQRTEARDIVTVFDDVEYERLDFNRLDVTEDAIKYGEELLSVPDNLAPEFASRFGVPVKFAEKIPWRLTAPLINYQISAAMEEHEERVRESSRDIEVPGFCVVKSRETNSISGFANKVITAVPNGRLFDAVADTMSPEDFLVHEASLSRTDFTLIGPRRLEVERGDIIRYGVNVQNSFDNSARLEIGGWIDRLVCSNGMTSREMIHTWHRGTADESEDNIVEWASEVAARAWEQGEHALEEFAQTRERELTPVELNDISAVLDELGLASRARGYVLQYFENNPPTTLYDVINGVTYIGTHDSRLRHGRTRRWMQTLAGDAIGHLHTCPSCHRLTTQEIEEAVAQ